MDYSDVKHLSKVVDAERLPRLENWFRWGTKMFGNVYNRPPFQDGEHIHTSRVMWQTSDRLQTKNTLYVLGKPAVSTD